MSVDPELHTAFRRFERRAILVAFARAFSIGLLVSVLAAEVAGVAHVPAATAAAAAVALAAIASAAYAWITRPDMLALARRIDERARLNDLVVTAIGGRGDGMHAIVRRAGIAALAKAPAARIHPFELPHHWRRWLIAAGVAQAVALPLAFRAPAIRAQTGPASLTLPSSSDSANTGRNREPQRPRPESSAPDVSQAEAGSKSSDQAVRRPAEGTDRPVSAGSASTSADGDRLRLAATDANAQIASGRVPLSRRAIVERYFATIQSQRKRPQ
jgi:hypothetical protein